ncbi:MAG: hypothetical protein OEV44_08025 [Spirochaetota bacterium]|nr:hypothetical protein [Spirochaetota bacterium]
MSKNKLPDGNKEKIGFINSFIVGNDLEDNKLLKRIINSNIINKLNDNENEKYRLNKLMFTLINELSNLGRKISYFKIKNDLENKGSSKDSLVYQVLYLDEKTNMLIDYYFILNTKLIELYSYKQKTDLLKDKHRLIRAINYLYSQLYKDIDETQRILELNGVSIHYNQLIHVIDENGF